MARVERGRRDVEAQHVDVGREPVVDILAELAEVGGLDARSVQRGDLREGVDAGVRTPGAVDLDVRTERLAARARELALNRARVHL